jgi:hypothetical protein
MSKFMPHAADSPIEINTLLSSHRMKACPKCTSKSAWQIPRLFWMVFFPGMIRIQCGNCRKRFWLLQKKSVGRQ